MEANIVQGLLTEFQVWYDLDLKAKQKYKAQLAPDFRLIDFLQRDENALSGYLSLLLDPQGRHGQGDLYLARFLALFPEARYQPKATDHSNSYTEFRLPSNRRLDVYLRFNTGGLAIENKPWASDQKEQLYDYATYLDKQHSGGSWALVYLSNGDISVYSLPEHAPSHLKNRIVGLDFFTLARWLEECAVLTQATSVRLFIETVTQFIRERINGELQLENGQELTQLMLRNEKNLRGAFYISQHLHEVKRQLWRDFADHLRSELDALGTELVFDEELINGEAHCVIAARFHSADVCGPSWAFNKRNHVELYFGICAFSEAEIKNMDAVNIKRAMDEFCDVPGRTTNWWPWWTFDSRAFSSRPVPSNWAKGPDAWLGLMDRSNGGFAAIIVQTVKRMREQFDLSLLRGR